MADATRKIDAAGADDEPPAGYERIFDVKVASWAMQIACVAYAAWHLWVLNVAPLETLTFRIIHVAGALCIGFLLARPGLGRGTLPKPAAAALDVVSLALVGHALARLAYAQIHVSGGGAMEPWVFAGFGESLTAGIAVAIVAGWFSPPRETVFPWRDLILVGATIAVAWFMLFGFEHMALRLRAGTGFADPQNGWTALAGVMLILELTRRVAGLALVVISAVFISYAFTGPFLPGFLEHKGYEIWRFFSYLYTGNGILGPTTAVSSTYIILFIIFAAFLQASRVGEYFVNFAFAAAGHARGGPAKVAVFASGLMGMINGTSAGNVVATGSLTIPLMKKVGYKPQTAAAVEAGASTGGQIMPPIMGAGAFIMAEITGIPYTELVVAALIPAVLYFTSIYFMVDFEARRLGMKGLPRDELPVFRELAKKAFLFIPIFILIFALYSGYSVIRAGAYATASAAIVSWLTPHAMGPRKLWDALALAARMSIQIIAVCACAGIIVGVIAMTGVGSRFSSLLLGLAEHSQLLALFFAMLIAIILGMGMPTTAAYAVAASVVAPGLVDLGIQPLIAHFFVFYYAVVSAITPPVALAAYAGAAIAGSEPMKTSVESFKIGLAAFIVPFMFFYSPGLLMEGEWLVVLRNFLTATAGVYLLSAAVTGYLRAPLNLALRVAVLAAAMLMISGGLLTDLIGVGVGLGVWALQSRQAAPRPAE
ncbi:MAG: TRAP transporter permease [Rubrimonas sp.]|uniref:TRAP transporter permease n=1 Tax=Rubrimonas sp. TaxID=2036015 RepID=UPI002FDEAE5E